MRCLQLLNVTQRTSAQHTSDERGSFQNMLPVVERFISINGEGRNAGKLAAFIRFPGCNLSCSYCDTTWANEAEVSCELLSVEDLVSYVVASDVRYVTLTGGEPTLQPFLGDLIDALVYVSLGNGEGLTVEIETNGATDITKFVDQRASWSKDVPGSLTLTMDYKLPSSGMEGCMKTDNFSVLSSEDTVKFVVGGPTDLERMHKIMTLFDLSRRMSVYVSPVFGSIDSAEIVEFMKSRSLNKAVLQLQLHKIIWPDCDRGV